ncbi:unnamed protein product [Rhizoctonia solani]|uniref:Lysine-specific metallo-endopeptidase domain-containing protein n=3 Tax=Rhizoctonia solani TaxID=456999 RepID=A0A8H2XKN3_9AGAM|nr:M35 family deuterolysin metalloprotease [Rhizoctonia solani AG-3 Rhs1AP]KEP46205.1 M35 family deuterolysin metalloprotease [Rhizoctonia solani 123E]CAE6429157.1 unnamed protein product [Rhizoctonia solani]CAE6461114.1 unnamed protein product [Rhizoctonia solani]
MRAAVATTLVFLMALPASAIPQLELTLLPSPGPNSLSVKSTLTNTGSETIKLLNDPRTVLSDAETETFVFTNANGAPDFTGIRAKYSPDCVIKKNDPTSFTILAPGQSHEAVHDLSGVYNFTRTGPGEYKIEALTTFDYMDETGRLASLKAMAEPSVFELTGRLVPSEKSASRFRLLKPRQSGLRFNKCSQAQQNDIAQAITDAEAYITEVRLHFETHNAETERYSTWFGQYDTAYHDKVKDHFGKIQGKSWDTLYDCDCHMANVYAYVYPDRAGVIHLCPAFWPAPAMGTDSKAGTLIHEQTHFTVNGGTRDYTYGQRSCRALAKSHPEKAVQNADSHEFFAENPPQ